MEKTIVAISTPLGRGAISIVRMSGQDSLQIAEKVFSNAKNIEPRYLKLGNFKFDDGSREKCLMVYFKAPFSYTGEDMVEFQIHGGTHLTQKVLSTLLDKGALLAGGGEFSRRAFENGKISLDEAEAIIGEINAESESELRASLSVADGKLKRKIISLQEDLTEQIAQIEATLDYPEEDFEKSAKESILNSIKNVQNEIENFIAESKNARYLKEGISVAIVGATNVGKSSLLNALIGEEKAIVTDIEGTTRDTISEHIFYNGVKINFIDTAGIRDAKDKVEQIGIEKSKKSVSQADVVLCVFDGSREMKEEDRQILKLAENVKHIIIVNKNDQKRVLKTLPNEISISAKDEKGLEKIKEKIFSLVISDEIDFNKLVLINERQIEHLKEAQSIVKEILNAQNESMDIIAMLIKNLWNALGKITGQCENEAIIDLIFSKFCLGK